MAEVGGKMYTVDPHKSQAIASQGRRLKEDHEREPPRLYEAHEFFIEAHGFLGNSRKLSKESDMGGFAAVALAAAESILDKYNTEFGTNHDSIGINGAFWTKPLADGSSTKQFEVALFLNITSGLWAVSRKTTATGITDVMDTTTGDGLWYRFDAQSKLVKCEQMQFLNSSEFKESQGVGEDGMAIEGIDINREGSFAIPLETFNFNGQAVFQEDARAIINTPSDADCMALRPQPAFGVSSASDTIVNETGGFRRRLASEIKPPMRHPVEGFRRELWQRGQSSASEEFQATGASHMLRGTRRLDLSTSVQAAVNVAGRNGLLKGDLKGDAVATKSNSRMGWYAASAAYTGEWDKKWPEKFRLETWQSCKTKHTVPSWMRKLGMSGGDARASFLWKVRYQ